MCGRFAVTLPPEAMRRMFGYKEQPNFPPRYNIAPTQPIAIVRSARQDGVETRHFTLARWAFLPTFVKDPNKFPLIFNARCEGIAEKASFRNALRRRRCLVPADAFYEWRRSGSGRAAASRPFLFRRVDGSPLALAGLWETWHGPNGEEVDTACIVTTGANGTSAAIHPRLPVVIEPAAFATWLEPDEAAIEPALALLRPPKNEVLCFVALSDAVNKVANDGPGVMTPIGDAAAPTSQEQEQVQPSLF